MKEEAKYQEHVDDDNCTTNQASWKEWRRKIQNEDSKT